MDKKIFTLLIDEPDRNLDIKNIKNLYPIFSNIREDTQIISVIHNPLLIYKLFKKCPYINFIETEKGYLQKIMEEIEFLVKL